MTNPSITMRHVALQRDEPCGVCAAHFVPNEDSGSRVVLIRLGEDSFTGLLCGGCASKFVHGTLTASFRNPILL